MFRSGKKKQTKPENNSANDLLKQEFDDLNKTMLDQKVQKEKKAIKVTLETISKAIIEVEKKEKIEEKLKLIEEAEKSIKTQLNISSQDGKDIINSAMKKLRAKCPKSEFEKFLDDLHDTPKGGIQVDFSDFSKKTKDFRKISRNNYPTDKVYIFKSKYDFLCFISFNGIGAKRAMHLKVSDDKTSETLVPNDDEVDYIQQKIRDVFGDQLEKMREKNPAMFFLKVIRSTYLFDEVQKEESEGDKLAIEFKYNRGEIDKKLENYLKTQYDSTKDKKDSSIKMLLVDPKEYEKVAEDLKKIFIGASDKVIYNIISSHIDFRMNIKFEDFLETHFDIYKDNSVLQVLSRYGKRGVLNFKTVEIQQEKKAFGFIFSNHLLRQLDNLLTKDKKIKIVDTDGKSKELTIDHKSLAKAFMMQIIFTGCNDSLNDIEMEINGDKLSFKNINLKYDELIEVEDKIKNLSHQQIKLNFKKFSNIDDMIALIAKDISKEDIKAAAEEIIYDKEIEKIVETQLQAKKDIVQIKKTMASAINPNSIIFVSLEVEVDLPPYFDSIKSVNDKWEESQKFLAQDLKPFTYAIKSETGTYIVSEKYISMLPDVQKQEATDAISKLIQTHNELQNLYDLCDKYRVVLNKCDDLLESTKSYIKSPEMAEDYLAKAGISPIEEYMGYYESLKYYSKKLQEHKSTVGVNISLDQIAVSIRKQSRTKTAYSMDDIQKQLKDAFDAKKISFDGNTITDSWKKKKDAGQKPVVWDIFKPESSSGNKEISAPPIPTDTPPVDNTVKNPEPSTPPKKDEVVSEPPIIPTGTPPIGNKGEEVSQTDNPNVDHTKTDTITPPVDNTVKNPEPSTPPKEEVVSEPPVDNTGGGPKDEKNPPKIDAVTPHVKDDNNKPEGQSKGDEKDPPKTDLQPPLPSVEKPKPQIITNAQIKQVADDVSTLVEEMLSMNNSDLSIILGRISNHGVIKDVPNAEEFFENAVNSIQTQKPKDFKDTSKQDIAFKASVVVLCSVAVVLLSFIAVSAAKPNLFSGLSNNLPKARVFFDLLSNIGKTYIENPVPALGLTAAGLGVPTVGIILGGKQINKAHEENAKKCANYVINTVTDNINKSKDKGISIGS